MVFAALVALSVLAGCLIGAAFDRMPPTGAAREAEAPERALNRLI